MTSPHKNTRIYFRAQNHEPLSSTGRIYEPWPFYKLQFVEERTQRWQEPHVGTPWGAPPCPRSLGTLRRSLPANHQFQSLIINVVFNAFFAVDGCFRAMVDSICLNNKIMQWWQAFHGMFDSSCIYGRILIGK